MKAILEFNLPEDKENFDFANNGLYYYLALFEFDQWLRSEYKYNGNEAMFKVREKLNSSRLAQLRHEIGLIVCYTLAR